MIAWLAASVFDTWWGSILVPLGIMVVIGVAVHLWDRPRLRRLRESHRQTHPPMSDEEFGRAIEAPDVPAEGVAQARRGLGKIMGVPPETLHPGDTVEYLAGFVFDNMDFIDVVMPIHQAFGVHMRPKVWIAALGGKTSTAQVTLGELIRHVAAYHRSQAAAGAVHECQSPQTPGETP